MLEIQNLDVYYGAIHALKGINFKVNQGEIVTLIGANGAGKSTSLKTISGLLRPKNGDIIFQGQNLNRVAAHKIVDLGISHVPEGRRVFANLTVFENLEMGAYPRSQDRKWFNSALERVYAKFPRLRERQNQPAGTLSGGEQQMLAMGRALMVQPKILLMDEPSMGLAPLLVRQIFDTIKEINADGTTILLVEQNAHLALSIAHRAYVIETGRIVLEGTSKELSESEQVRKAYLGG